MKRLKKFYKQLTQRDKLLHFAYGFFIYVFFSLLLSNEYAMGITIGIAILKEAIWDFLLKKGTPEQLDWIMTALPAIILYFLS